MISKLAPRSGTAFELKSGQTLTVIDPMGEQVADLLAYNLSDIGEVISSGRTLDYAVGRTWPRQPHTTSLEQPCIYI